ncbi:hypothetical protein ACFFP0_06960 [Rhizobium puerariae]|uniref:Transketolase N-terminal domain-containing protein n=1 Tax=Rhizobium puerariae TaxID=1585791 RepID=A0ABV6AFX8_9HYPH
MSNDDRRERQPAPRIADPVELARIARSLRRDVIELVAPTRQGYVQQELGAADIFTVLYFAELRLDPADPDWPDRDRFLLSTAHNTAIFYATLAARGIVDPAAIRDYCRDGSVFEINASERAGTAIEATLFAGSAGLSNLCLIVDDNRMQVEGHIDKVVSVAPIAGKFRAFGWMAEDVDGHDIPALLAALERARAHARPTCLVAATVAGKGVPGLEGLLAHNLRLPPEVAAEALAALAETHAGEDRI